MSRVQDYSPAELLQFGQRAEADGDLDYALRVYAYLANNFPDTVEGEIAFDGYNRIEARIERTEARPAPDPLRQPAPAHHTPAQAPTPTYAPPAPRSTDKQNAQWPEARTAPQSASRSAVLSDRLASLQKPGYTPPGTSSKPSPSSTHGGWLRGTTPAMRSAPAPIAGTADAEKPFSMDMDYGLRETKGTMERLDSPRNEHPDWAEPLDEERDTVLPRMVARALDALDESEGDLEQSFQRRYRAGSAIAVVFAVLGWLLLACGLALLGVTASAAFPQLAASGISGFAPAGIEVALGALLMGLVLVFASQVGSAILDNANATRHLLAIERAKAGY